MAMPAVSPLQFTEKVSHNRTGAITIYFCFAGSKPRALNPGSEAGV